jgi:sialic acid synthase SpsE
MIKSEFYIDGILIKNFEKPFIIAEAGSNHNQSMETAYKLIDIAAESGADAIKFQIFLADKLYAKNTEMYNIFKNIELNRDWIPKLFHHAKERNIIFLASAFDTDSVDLLDDIGVPAFKIASSEVLNFKLLYHIAKKSKPLIISTGMCDLVDVYDTFHFCVDNFVESLCLLQCGAVYPLPIDEANIRVMDIFKKVFSCPVGFSDHTLGYGAAVAACARGASIIEKHITLNKNDDGPDHFYALEPQEFTQMNKIIYEAFLALGAERKEMLPEEKETGRREGLYAAKDLKKGEILESTSIESLSPALGITRRHITNILGGKINRDVSKGEPMFWKDVSF